MDLNNDLKKDELAADGEQGGSHDNDDEKADGEKKSDYEPIIGAYTKDDIFTQLIKEARARSDEKAKEQAEKAAKEDEEVFIAGDGLDDDDFEDIPADEPKPAPDISVSVNEQAKSRSAKRGLADKIKNAEVLKPEVIKDMFFGSKEQETDHRFAPDNAEDYGEDEEFEDPVIFDQNRKKRMAADPNQDKMIFSIEYMLTPDQALDGYMLFYNEFVKKSNIKLTLIMGIMALIFLFAVIVSPKGYLSYMLLLMTLSVIALKWLNSASAKKEAVQSADDVKNDSYRLDFYNSRILLKASELTGDKIYNYPPVMIRFEDIDLKVLDYEEFYVLIFKKNYVYTVPKNAMNKEQNGVFRKLLENILGDDYYEYYSREREAAERAERRKKKIAARAAKAAAADKNESGDEKASDKKVESTDKNAKDEKGSADKKNNK